MHEHYDATSRGPSVDALALKFSGDTPCPEDLRRTQEVEIVLRGVVTGHSVDDKRGKTGDIEATVKTAKLKLDELVSLTLIQRPKQRVPEGQTALGEDGAVIDARTLRAVEDELQAAVGDDVTVSISAQTGEVIETAAGPETESSPTVPPGGGDDENFDAAAAAPAPERHPQVPEQAWGELDHEQQRDVLARVEKFVSLATYLSGTDNPTDRKVAEDKVETLLGALHEDYGIALLDPEDVVEEDERVAPPSEPPPPPVTVSSPPMTQAQLSKRKAYLLAKRALPKAAATARDEEIAEIDRRLATQGAA